MGPLRSAQSFFQGMGCNSGMCDISSLSLNGFEKEQREAVKMRDNACAGRPVRPFPADIIQR